MFRRSTLSKLFSSLILFVKGCTTANLSHVFLMRNLGTQINHCVVKKILYRFKTITVLNSYIVVIDASEKSCQLMRKLVSKFKRIGKEEFTLFKKLNFFISQLSILATELCLWSFEKDDNYRYKKYNVTRQFIMPIKK